MTVDSRKKVQPEEDDEDVTIQCPPLLTSFAIQNLSLNTSDKMRLQVQIGTECVVVPCKPEDTVHSVARKSVEKLRRLRPKLPLADNYFEVRRTVGNSLLDPEDLVSDVLKDSDFIIVAASIEETEDAKEAKKQEEIDNARAELEKIDNRRRKVSFADSLAPMVLAPPTKLLILDGNSLLPEDLVKCEKGECAIQLSMEAEDRIRKARTFLEKIASEHRAFCVSYVPQQGTVGCSGDLCPLAHLALGLLGEGKMWSPVTGWQPADLVLRKNNLEPLELGPKEGLALINGTQMVTALGAYTLERAHNIARQADVIAALSLDVLKGTTRAYDPDIHRIRPHRGQNLSALRLRALLHSEANPSQIAESHRNCRKVQDAYTLRCVPQVHGVVHDTIEFVREIITTEMNSATDNPLVFADREEIISGGNFHGEYPAKALDYLAIAVAELAQMSERRLERLVNKELSGLPTFLTPDGGLNSGFMTVQLCAASLVSENKVLCHPSSVDSIPTSCNQEDHVSMGGFSARKALTVVEHVEAVLAMELLAACQGIEFLKPLMSTAPLHKVYTLVRSVAPPLNEDRYMKPEIDAVVEMIRENRVWDTVLPHLETLEAMEELDPDALRQFTKTPTGIVQDRSLIPISDDEDSLDGN
uniref:Histidine ammonia-lyase n=1 Tax=Caenorhabditis tropicalis TaxID=1561998 RepID=A0A1I7U174_9PELO